MWTWYAVGRKAIYLPTGQTCTVCAESSAHKGVRYYKAVLDGEGYDFSAEAEKFKVA